MSEKEINTTPGIPGTSEADYTESLLSRQSVWWKKLLDVQAPYRWHIRSIRPGYVLDVGCGIGRN
ncbi:MAG: methyltransferase type 11, partial [Chryseobacterium sp.]